MNNIPELWLNDGPFAKDPFVEKKVAELIEKYNCTVGVETGTMKGITTKWLSQRLNTVHTIELDDYYHNYAQDACKPYNNINFIKGDSIEQLEKLLPQIENEQCFFFLDAHCHAICPTAGELQVIKKLKKLPVIVIHDFYVPGKDFGWDSYPYFEYKWENISHLIDDIYGKDGYEYYYNTETHPESFNRGVLYVVPKELKSKVKMYVCHYPPLVDRKEYLDSTLPGLDIPYEFFSYFNRENIAQYEKYFSTDKSVLEYKNSFVAHKVNEPLTSPSIKATNLEHIRIYNAIINSRYEYHLILEDDAVLCPNFKERLYQTIDTLPQDWDVVYVSSGCENRPSITSSDDSNFAKIETKNSWTANGYLIKKETAKKFIDNIRPIILPIDFELNFIQNYLNMNVYWLVDSIVYEGSNPVSGPNYKYNTSQIR
jgi:glycosyl transferase family 25